MSGALLYLDASALVKLVVAERESGALAQLVGEWPSRVSSRIAEVEVVRALRRAAATPAVDTRGREVLAGVAFLEFDRRVARHAGTLDPPALRALDAIQLASALSLGSDLGAFVTYDVRLDAAAIAAGLDVRAPA